MTTADRQLPTSRFTQLCPCVIRLVARPAPPETEALETALGILVAQPKRPHLAGRALLALDVLLALASSVSIALTLSPLLVTLVLNSPRGVTVAGATVGEVVVAGGALVAVAALVTLQAPARTSVQVTLVGNGTLTVALTWLEINKYKMYATSYFFYG